MVDPFSDQQLVRGLRAGDERAFDAFFNTYLPRVYRFVLTRVERDETTAEEVSQTVLTRAIQRIGAYRGEASLFTWVCQIARNEITDLWRVRQRRAQVEVLAEDNPHIAAALESMESDPAWRPDTQGSRAETTRLVQVALDSLPGSYGNALEWKYIDGYSVAEIADRLGLSVVAAQSLLSRARLAFKEAFGTLGGADELEGLS
ncbi:MAG: RNA polymerase sigma factor [Steroidobacteraceae bacterium]